MAELAGRMITAALVVVPGPEGTVTLVRQERGPYAGGWPPSVTSGIQWLWRYTPSIG
jgi:hypothetical protein